MSDSVESIDVCEQPKKKCFIITPVGPDNSDIRRAAEGVIDSGIIPVLKELDFEVEVPHRLFGSGSITKAVINKIIEDELVIANLTGLNPNVMYELGIRHSVRKPVIHIRDANTILPFDVAPERTLQYTNDMFGIQEFKPKLKAFIDAAMKEPESNNPVYDAIQAKNIMKNVGDKDPLKYVIESIDELKHEINKVTRNNSAFDYNDHNLRNVEWLSFCIPKVNLSKNQIKYKLIEEFLDIKTPAPNMRINNTDNQTILEFRKSDCINIEPKIIMDIIDKCDFKSE